MENHRMHSFHVILFTTFAVISSVLSQRQHSNGSPVYSQQQTQLPPECGIQDKEELPDFHAAAPWAAALFYVEGDIFRNEFKPQYLSTAIFISRNLAITCSSSKLAEQESGLLSKLQLYYGHRASGKQTLIRIRKVEPLALPREPLALRVEASSSGTRNLQNQQRKQSEGKADLYLLHLESLFDITSFSRPLCISENIFQYKNQYFRNVGSSNTVHISGYASKNETLAPKVYYTADREWRVHSWDSDNIDVMMMTDKQLTSEFQPKHFNPGSALTVKSNHQFFLAGILLRSSGSRTTFRSLEKFAEIIQMKEREYAPAPFNHGVQINNDNGNLGRDRYPSSSNNNGNTHLQKQKEFLETSEFEEQQQSSPAYGQQVAHNQQAGHQSSNNNNNWGTQTRSTARPDSNSFPGASSRPSLLTQRPDFVYTPQAQQQPEYNYNPNPSFIYTENENGRRQQQQQQGDSSVSSNKHGVRPSETRYTQSMHGSTSTVRNNLPSHVPPYTQYYETQQRQPPQPDRLPHYSQYPKCSHDYLEGVDIECLSRQKGVSTADCIKSAPVNTTIRLSCKPYYIPLDGERSIEKTCDASGNWLPRKTFDCKLDCGTKSETVPYIVHGSKAKQSQWPWHAALFKKVNETSYTYICGATLITRSILASAAHCLQDVNSRMVNRSLYKVVVGAISSHLQSNRKDPSVQEYDIKTVRVNEHYNPRNFEADIALIQIEKPVLLSDYVRPVCFPFPSDENKQRSGYQLSEGNLGTVVGFGTSEDWRISGVLRMATLPVVSVKNCSDVLERQPSSTQYCAGYTNGTSVCEGDSGGAQIFSDQFSKRYYIQGIISHGNRKEPTSSVVGHARCDHEKYTVFTKVSSFSEWVKEVVYDLEFDYNRRRRRRRQSIS